MGACNPELLNNPTLLNLTKLREYDILDHCTDRETYDSQSHSFA